jgi:hypothetical protein
VVEALKEGVPLVTTPVGAQGLPGIERIVPVETDPDRFADAVCALLLDDALWERQCVRQIDYATARFGADGLREALLAGMAAPAPERRALAA